MDGGAAGRAGRPAGWQWRVVAADDDGLRVGAALGAGGLCVAVAREVVVELAQGRGAGIYGRVVDGDRLALGGGRHEAGAGRRRVGLLEGEEREGIASVTMLRGAEESRRGGLLSWRLRLCVRLRLRLRFGLRLRARLGAQLRLRLRVKVRLSARARGGQRHGGLRDGAKVVKYGGYMSGRLVGRGFGYRRRSVQGLSKTPGAATCKLCRNSRHSRRLDKGSDRVWPGLVSSQDGGESEEGRIRGRAVLASVLLLATEWHDSWRLCLVMRPGRWLALVMAEQQALHRP